ncbi:MAG: ligase-associated DNA damage response exonuclease [Saprospiraceae bacterium]|nr:ligase-associated DNA damage response exonuclease [Saprospiraceae bacterium]
MPLIEFKKEGLYVPAADVYIDPWRRVRKALITHGHSDHARWGHQQYICSHHSKPIIKHRLGDINVHGVAYGEELSVNGVKFTFFPAGHIVGSAQIRVEHQGEVWVVSGDYKTEDDGISGTFSPIKCHTFITECTFGLPIYTWVPQQQVFDKINHWWSTNQANGVTSILMGYSLGKAQRLLAGIDASIGPIYTHGAVEQMNAVIKTAGIPLPPTKYLNKEVTEKELAGSLVITPQGATRSTWMKRFGQVSLANASGWMQLRGARRRGGADRGFVLSDHADWQGLNDAITATGAETVYATHGYTNVFKQWLDSRGLDARVVQTKFEGELSEENSVESSQSDKLPSDE